MARKTRERSPWTPKLDSWSLGRYRLWQQYTGKEIAQENFCHYLRVVLIWVPRVKIAQWGKRHANALNLALVLFTVTLAFGAFSVLFGAYWWPVVHWWAYILGPLTVLGILAGMVSFGLVLDYASRRREQRQAAAEQGLDAQRDHSAFVGFFILIGPIIRTKKRRICPLVEIPPE